MKLQIIEIPSNSELFFVGNEAFSNTLIENIFIPAHLIDLNECWCCEMNKLVNISISKENLHFNLYDGLMIEKVDESGC